jgi:hypothetical protein
MSVLLEDDQLGSPGRANQVLGGDSGEETSVTRPVTWLCPAGTLAASAASTTVIFSGRTPTMTAEPVAALRCPGQSEDRAVGAHLDHLAVRDLRPRDQIGLAEEVRDEGRPGQLVDVGRMAQLLDAPGIHDRDRVGHGHGLLLVVGHVHEGGAHLGLDALELDLHLPTQLRGPGHRAARPAAAHPAR